MTVVPMKKATYKNGRLYCACGHVTGTDFEDRLSEELAETKFQDDLEDTEDVICGRCKRNYALTICVEKIIQLDSYNLEETSACVADINGHDYDLSQLDDLSFGDAVPLADGEYVSLKYEYRVVNGVIAEIFNAVLDEDQLSLFENMEEIAA